MPRGTCAGIARELTCTVIWKGIVWTICFRQFPLSCIKDWCINYNLDMVSGRYVTEKTYDEQYGHELVIQ